MAKILVVEDDGPLREALYEALLSQGFEVREASDVAGADRLIATERFDAIVTDVSLPGNGYTILDTVRERCPATPVIMMTGIEEDDSGRRARAQGAYDYLVKPLRLGLLKSTLDRACAENLKPPASE